MSEMRNIMNYCTKRRTATANAAAVAEMSRVYYGLKLLTGGFGESVIASTSWLANKSWRHGFRIRPKGVLS